MVRGRDVGAKIDICGCEGYNQFMIKCDSEMQDEEGWDRQDTPTMLYCTGIMMALIAFSLWDATYRAHRTKAITGQYLD